MSILGAAAWICSSSCQAWDYIILSAKTTILGDSFPLSKGNMCTEKIDDISDHIPVPADQQLKGNTLGMEYLYKIIEECRRRDIKLVITALPFAREYEKQEGLHTGVRIAREENIPVLDFSYCPDLLDYSISFAGDGHPNAYGGTVMTQQIGAFIKANYDITDHRKGDVETSEKWENDYKELEEKYLGRLKKRK